MQEKQKKSDLQYWMFGLRIVGELGGLIAIPVVVFVLVGRWVDERWNTKPILTIVAFLLAFGVSAVLVWRRTKEVAGEYQKLVNQESQIKNQTTDDKSSDA